MTSVQKLVYQISKEKQKYNKLLGIEKEKQEALKEKDLQKIDETVKKEQGVLLEIKLVEKQREEARLLCAKELACAPEEITLRALIDLVPPEQRQTVEVLREEFLAVVDDFRMVAEINRRLIEEELDFVNFALNLATEEGSASGHYDQAGNMGLETTHRPGLFDQKA